MDFKEFTKMILCKVQLYLGNEYEVAEQKITKNNGVRLTGIMAKKKGINTFPTVYINEYFREEMNENDVEYLAMKLSRSLQKAELNENVDLENFMNYECVKDHLTLKLVNAEQNKDLLFEVPHKRFHNLAVLFYYLVDNDLFDGRASILIRNSHLSMWDVDVKTLYEDALSSAQIVAPAQIVPMRDLLKELYGHDVLDDDFPMYVLTNREKYHGASAVLYRNALKKFADEKGTDFYVLPSSVHELILIPDDGNVEARELLTTVTDINRTQVSKEERLSDSVYYYDREKDRLNWVS